LRSTFFKSFSFRFPVTGSLGGFSYTERGKVLQKWMYASDGVSKSDTHQTKNG
jgi:hypothetical protein